MLQLIDTAYAMAPNAGGAAPEGGNFMASLPFLLLMIGVMYFLVIRPQKKQADDHKKFLSNIQKGDEVMTSGGIYGKVAGIAEQVITVEVAANIKIKVLKSHVHKAPAGGSDVTTANQPQAAAGK